MKKKRGKILIIILLSIVCTIILTACAKQVKDDLVPTDNPPNNIVIEEPDEWKYFKTYHISNFLYTVTNEANAPISNAYVKIYETQNPENIIIQGYTNSEGLLKGFGIVRLAYEQLSVEVSALGYETLVEAIIVNQDNLQVELSAQLTESVVLAQTVVIPDYYITNYPDMTVSFEDLYPQTINDWDLNDLVIYQSMSAQMVSGDNYISSLTITTNLMARGASSRYDSDLNYKLGFTKLVNNIDVTITYYDFNGVVTTTSVTHYDNVSDIYMNIFTNTSELFDTKETSGVNTNAGYEFSKGSYTVAKITFNDQTSTHELFNNHSFDPYLSVYNPNTEQIYDIHQPYFPSIPGSPNPSLGNHQYFIDDNNFPYCIAIPAKWSWPLDNASITDAYQEITSWIGSNFVDIKNWYEQYNNDYVYNTSGL